MPARRQQGEIKAHIAQAGVGAEDGREGEERDGEQDWGGAQAHAQGHHVDLGPIIFRLHYLPIQFSFV